MDQGKRNHFSNTTTFGKTKQCISCHLDIDAHSHVCPYCDTSQDLKVECEYCGALNNASNDRCDSCNAFIK